MNTDPSAFIHLLQFADGLFPAGGYAHSSVSKHLSNQAAHKPQTTSRHSSARIWKTPPRPPTRSSPSPPAKPPSRTICQPASASIECSKL
jgi:hypothetical protein